MGAAAPEETVLPDGGFSAGPLIPADRPAPSRRKLCTLSSIREWWPFAEGALCRALWQAAPSSLAPLLCSPMCAPAPLACRRTTRKRIHFVYGKAGREKMVQVRGRRVAETADAAAGAGGMATRSFPAALQPRLAGRWSPAAALVAPFCPQPARMLRRAWAPTSCLLSLAAVRPRWRWRPPLRRWPSGGASSSCRHQRRSTGLQSSLPACPAPRPTWHTQTLQHEQRCSQPPSM